MGAFDGLGVHRFFDHGISSTRGSNEPQVDEEKRELVEMLKVAIKVLERTANDTLDGRNAAEQGRALLAKIGEEC